MTAVWLSEVCTEYSGRGQAGGRGPARARRHRHRRRPGPGRQPDPDDLPEQPRGRRPARQPGPRQLDHPPGGPRRGPRVPHAARASPRRCRRSINRLLNRRDDAQGARRRRRGRRSSPSPARPAGSAAPRSPSTSPPRWPRPRPRRSSLADFDLMLGSLDACLDIIPDQTLQGVVQNIDRLDLTLLKRSMTRHASGLYVLPHPVAHGGRREDRPGVAPAGPRAAQGRLPDRRHRHQQGPPVGRLRRLRGGRRHRHRRSSST